jgi:hypothetical protein
MEAMMKNSLPFGVGFGVAKFEYPQGMFLAFDF